MKSPWIVLALGLAFSAPVYAQGSGAPPGAAESDDEHLWLEDVMGEKALAWVKERNAETTRDLAGSPEFTMLESELLGILESDARILGVSKQCDRLYNFWRDASHPRGIWRRTTFDEYRKPEPNWDVLLDLDALAEAEGESWDWHGAQILRRGCRRALVALSRGGTD